ncbi:MAG TPA: hypothetical protein VGO11_20270 [Chthoniobacteraceae bacterium]|jgi:hypothetical protein|nr:hypothetical protein [Chthoniobacteraceae bacterium]
MMRLIVACLLALAPLARPADSPRLAIVADASVKSEADLLTVAISRTPVVLLERAEIERVLAEQKLAARGLAQAVQVGRVLRADGVLVLSKIARTPVCRLVAVETGAVLDSQLAPPEMKDPGEWIAAIADDVTRLSPRLARGAAPPLAISVAGLRAAAGLESEETPFAALLTHALAQQPGFVVLERQRLLVLAQEKEFGPDLASPFWASRMLLGGSLERDPQSPDGLLVKARLQPPHGAAIELAVRGSRTELGTLARELARLTAEALHQPPGPVAWDARAEAARFGREARAACSVGLWDLAESAGGAAWALGDHGVELARLRLQIQLERLINTNRISDQFGVAVLQSMTSTSAIACCEDLGHRRAIPMIAPFEPYAGFRFPEDLAGARQLLDLYWAWEELARPSGRRAGPDLEDRTGARTFCLAALPLVLVHRQADPANFAPQIAALKARLAETLPRLLAANEAAAAVGRSDSGDAARGVQQLRYLQGFFAVFQADSPEAWRSALSTLLAEEAQGDPARMQLRAGLLKAQSVAPLYLPPAAWRAEVFHEAGSVRTRAASPDDRLFAFAMLDRRRLGPEARQARAVEVPQRIWELRDSFVREPEATRAFTTAALQRLYIGWTEGDEIKGMRMALEDVKRRLFLHVVAGHGRADPYQFWGDLSIANWKQEEAAAFNQAFLAHIAELQATVGPRSGDTQRFIRWQEELRARFPALPGPSPSQEAAALPVTRFWNAGTATKLVPVAPEEGFRIWRMSWQDGRLWVHADLRLPSSRPIGAPTKVRVFLLGVEPRSGTTEVIEVPNLGGMNEGQPLGAFTVSPDYIVVVKSGAPALKLRRATGEWKAYEQFRNDRLFSYGPVLAGGEAFITMGTEIARWNLQTDAVTTFVRTRREPPETPLDNPRYGGVWALAGPDGLPIVQGVEVPGRGQVNASFRFIPATNQWEKCAAFYADERAVHRCVLDPAAEEKWAGQGEKRGIDYVRLEGGRPAARCHIPLAFTLSEKDQAALKAGERTYPEALKKLSANLESAEKAVETPDGLVFFRVFTPGFWFIPKEDLAAYVAAHGMVVDPRSASSVTLPRPAAPNATETKP